MFFFVMRACNNKYFYHDYDYDNRNDEQFARRRLSLTGNKLEGPCERAAMTIESFIKVLERVLLIG